MTLDKRVRRIAAGGRAACQVTPPHHIRIIQEVISPILDSAGNQLGRKVHGVYARDCYLPGRAADGSQTWPEGCVPGVPTKWERIDV